MDVTATQDSTFEWRELGAQVTSNGYDKIGTSPGDEPPLVAMIKALGAKIARLSHRWWLR
jgi:hypothetical protein